MQKWIKTLMSAIAVLSLITIVSCTPAETNVISYAEDRAQIEDLQARYMFALDFSDADTYVKTFTEDGILDIVGMKWQGREEIRKIFADTPAKAPEGQEKPAEPAEEAVKEAQGPSYPATGRHNITNIVLKIDGDKASGRAYWFHYGNNNPERKAQLNSYGHYEDEMVKVNGQWLFSKRIIYNEQMAEWIGPAKNPCW
ncbi:MAG: nuclear transport factor 2 family protein [Deltaproteobacteria bacterium]|nr:nuclear transport factor 2 family protein [Deltaproteobacteria bacterium]